MVMEALIKTCRKEKMTAFHLMTNLTHCSRIIHLDSGKIVEDESGGLKRAMTAKHMLNRRR